MNSRNSQVYIGGITRDVTTGDIRKKFSEHGSIVSLSIKHKYAFVEFDDHRAAQDAIDNHHNKKAFGQDKITVELTHQRSGGGGGDRDRGDRGDRGDRSDRRGRDRDRDRDGRRGPRGYSPGDKCFKC